MPVVDVERVQQADTISLRQVRELPINRRDYLNLATLTPGVAEINNYVGITDAPLVQAPNSGLSFGGNNGRGNVFWLDGSENYVNTGGVRPSISQEAVAEFHVDRSSYSAEFGGGIGGIVNIVSQSGSNQIHGDMFGFLRHRSIQARNYFDPGKAAFTRTQMGATLGAPIQKDRTFVFLGFERLQREETAFVPILSDRSIFSTLLPSQQQLVDVFNVLPIAQFKQLAMVTEQALKTDNFPSTLALFNANSGLFPLSERNALGSVRVDHAFSDNHRLFARFNAANGDSQNSGEGLIGYNRGLVLSTSDRTLMFNDTRVISERLVSESRLLFNRTLYSVANRDRIGPSLEINGYGYFGKDSVLPSDLREWHGQFQQNLFYTKGRHSLRFGIDINPVHDSALVQTNLGGRFSFGQYLPLGTLYNVFNNDPNTQNLIITALKLFGHPEAIPNLDAPITALQAFNLGIPSVYIQAFGDPTWRGWFFRYNGFINDVFHVNPHLTVNIGLRYEHEENPPELNTNPNNFAPRVGLAWSPFNDRKTVIRTGYGLFYQRSLAQNAVAVETQSGTKYNQIVVPLTGLPGSKNPATGQPYTSADIYQTLLAQGVIGTRQIAASDLRQFGIVPGPNFPYQVVFVRPVNWKTTYAQQASFEIERAIKGFSVSAAYNFTRSAHLPRIRDLNVKYGPPGPHGEPTFLPVDPLTSELIALESAANSFYNALIVQVVRRFGSRFTLNAHYTFSKSIDEVSDLNFLPNDSLNARKERALSAFDQRHRVVGSAIWDLPGTGRRGDGAVNALFGGFVLSPIVVASSGRPFNVVTGVDYNSRRPEGAGRNIGRGPNFFTADIRLSRRFPLGHRDQLALELIGEGFNLLNRTNFLRLNNTVGNLTVDELPHPLVGKRGNPTEPLSFLSAYDPRQFQFAIKVHF